MVWNYHVSYNRVIDLSRKLIIPRDGILTQGYLLREKLTPASENSIQAYNLSRKYKLHLHDFS